MSRAADKTYEMVVKRLLATKLRQEGLAQLVAYHLKKYQGKSGQEHEIDVSFEVKVGELDLLFLAECKNYSRKVGVDDVMAFTFRLQDIGAHKGLMVTTAGFQSGAVKVAKASGIALVIVAAGRIVKWYRGFIGSLFEVGMKELELNLSPQGTELELHGNRRIVANQKWSLFRLSESDATSDDDLERLTFLPPEEEERVDDKVDILAEFSPSAQIMRAHRDKRVEIDDLDENRQDRLI